MKAKDLINLLTTIDPEADVLTPVGSGNGAASDFMLTQAGIHYSPAGRNSNSAPHIYDDLGADGTVPAYLLDGVWTVTYNAQERKRREKD